MELVFELSRGLLISIGDLANSNTRDRKLITRVSYFAASAVSEHLPVEGGDTEVW